MFWGYQFFIVMAALSYVMGFSEGKEYAEPEWHIDLWLTIVWVVYLIVFLGTILKREEPHIYVANWFYLAFIVTVAMLHIVNNLSMPVACTPPRATRFTPACRTRWCSGGTATTRSGFFLTAGFLGMMYYFIPKAANRPVYSYRLSVVHFWSLIFLYIWAGPHHLHWTALPDWAQTLGMVFSVMLWMPSWGGMINGMMTLSGAWDKLRTDPGLRFSVTAVGFYGMSTFEGPVMSVRQVNALSALHRLDHRPRALRCPGLGGVHRVRRDLLSGPGAVEPQALYSTRLAAWHYWIATIGIVLYIISMWVAGIMRGPDVARLRQHGFLQYSFVESVMAMHPYYVIRLLGGLFFLIGTLIMAYNLIQTIISATTEAPRDERDLSDGRRAARLGSNGMMFIKNEFFEKNAIFLLFGTLMTVVDRRHRRDRPAVHHRDHGRARARDASLLAARVARPRHLRARGLLPLPQPADQGVA